MPTAPLRRCSGSPLCPNYAGQCPTHTRAAWGSQQGKPKRITGRRLQAARERLYNADPHCRACGRLMTPSAMIRDHIVPLTEGGEDIEANTQPVCADCHQAKTAAEAQRGRGRVSGGY